MRQFRDSRKKRLKDTQQRETSHNNLFATFDAEMHDRLAGSEEIGFQETSRNLRLRSQRHSSTLSTQMLNMRRPSLILTLLLLAFCAGTSVASRTRLPRSPLTTPHLNSRNTPVWWWWWWCQVTGCLRIGWPVLLLWQQVILSSGMSWCWSLGTHCTCNKASAPNCNARFQRRIIAQTAHPSAVLVPNSFLLSSQSLTYHKQSSHDEAEQRNRVAGGGGFGLLRWR